MFFFISASSYGQTIRSLSGYEPTTGRPGYKYYDTLIPIGTENQVLTVVSGSPAWATPAAGSSGWLLTGNTATAGADYIGTNNNISFRMRTNGLERAVLDSNGRFGVGIISPLAKFHIASNAIGVTATDANSVILENETAATVGAPQWSPAFMLRGNSWNAVGSVSTPWRWRANVQTLSGSGTGSYGSLYWQYSNNLGAWTTFARFNPATPELAITASINQTAVGVANIFRDPISLSGATTQRYIYFAGTLGFVIAQDNTTSDLNFRTNNATTNTTGTISATIFDSTGKFSINNTVHDADYSARLEVNDSARGFLPPRMTTSQRDSMAMYVASLDITQPGTGYTGTPTVTFAAATYPYIRAVYSATQSGGGINLTTLVTPGFYARTPATPTVVGGPGTGAVLTPVMAQKITKGMIIYNTTTDKLQCWNGSIWNDLF